jgi:hypothetical protein
MASVVRRPSCVLLTALALVTCATACGGGGKKHDAAATTAPEPGNGKRAKLAIGRVVTESYGPDTPVPEKLKNDVLAQAQRYVDTAITAPYETGELGHGYAELFDAGVRPQATAEDLGVLTDVRLGRADYTAKATPVTLSALSDESGGFVYLATSFIIESTVKTANGPVKVTRAMELTFAPADFKLSVTAYRALTRRAGPKGATTTTTTAGAAG